MPKGGVRPGAGRPIEGEETKKTLREKILSYLSVQSQRCGKTYFEIPLGRVELANYLCAHRSALTRELNTMRDEGIIDFDKNTFRILKKD